MSRSFRIVAVAFAVAAMLASTAIAASSPSVSTGSVKSVKQTSATLLGTINPNGSSTTYAFQWGLTSAYGVTGHSHSAGSGTKSVSVSGHPGGLLPGTAYHYRVIAFNRYGATAGRDRTFTTVGPPPPGASTGPATHVTPNSALLTGTIAPNKGVTGWRFEYGLTTGYGYATSGGTVPAGTAPVVVTQALVGLAPGTIFHYRLVAFHGSIATTPGNDMIFMTEPAKRPRPAFSAATRPHRARHRPFVFTTSGRVRGPASIPGVFDCTGSVAVRFYLGRRDLTFALVPLQPDCSFSAQTVFSRLPGRGRAYRRVVVRIAVRFRGNGYLQSVGARSQLVMLG